MFYNYEELNGKDSEISWDMNEFYFSQTDTIRSTTKYTNMLNN